MSSSTIFQKTSPRSLGWNTGRSGFSEPGCHRLGIRAGLAVGRPRPCECQKVVVQTPVGLFHLIVAFVCRIACIQIIIQSLMVYVVSVAGSGSDPLQLNLCISPVPFSFGVWCHFCPSRVMPSDPDTVCKNGAQVSHRCLSFSPAYRFGDGHASMPDRSFILSC